MLDGKIPKNKVYLDVCTLCRPFDDQRLMRIRLETDSYYLIIKAVQNGELRMIVSPAHLVEVRAIADHQERTELLALLEKYGTKAESDTATMRERAEYLYSRGFGIADAAHVAFAEKCSDFFISCDDRLIRKCRRFNIGVAAVNPLEFCVRENLK